MERLIESLRRHESTVLKVYLDSKGFPTCGTGHLLWVGSRVPSEACEAFFKQDVADAMSSYQTIPPYLRKRLNANRARVIVELLFAMNVQKVLKFTKMWGAIEKDDFEEAAKQLLDSEWARIVGDDPPSGKFPLGQRAWELAEILRKGE